MKQILFYFFLCLSTFSLSAQDLLITNGYKTRSIKKESLLQVGINDPRLSSRSECSCMQISGVLLDYTKDSLTIKLSTFEASFDKLKPGLTNNIDFSRGDIQQRYAINDIITLQKFKSQSHQNRKFGLKAFGLLFVSTGIITALQFPLAGNSRGRKNLLASGGIQVLAGITMASFSAKKTYYFKGESPLEGEIWRVK